MARDQQQQPPIQQGPAAGAKAAAALIRQRTEQLAARKVKVELPPDNDFLQRYPNLWTWLTCSQVTEELGKDPARLSFEVDHTSGLWVVGISDNSLRQSGRVRAPNFIDALAALELAVVQEGFWVPFRKRRGIHKLTGEGK